MEERPEREGRREGRRGERKDGDGGGGCVRTDYVTLILH